MGNLQFSINSSVEPKKLMSFIIDFERYQKFFPNQIKEVKKFDADLKLSLKAKFLAPLIKKLYKRYLTAIIFKITEHDQNQ